VLLGSLVTSASAANPGSGTISPTSREKSWSGMNYVAAATVDPNACLPKEEDPQNLLCDHFTLTSGVPSSYWTGKTGGAEVSISWADAMDDFDLYAYDSQGDMVASSAQGNTRTEKLTIDKAAGTYEIRVLPFLVTNSAYTGNATFRTAAATSNSHPLGGPAQYHGTRITGALPATEPQNTKIRPTQPALSLKAGPVGREAAEPTIGVDSKGRAFYAAATFDGPEGLANTRIRRSINGGKTWVDKTPPLTEATENQDFPVTLDPYVYVEENSGRVFDLDLYVGSSYLSFSDDGGETWETNPAASGPNIVNDHQTLFAGPRPANSPIPAAASTDPKFKEYLYYCFNRVTDSNCSRSVDGGRTFANTGEPAYLGVNPNTGKFCGGLHGHVATDRAGRVFLPRGYCEGVNDFDKPFVSISDDAGTTWKQVKVSDTVGMPDNQSSIASDARNNLYYVWYDHKFKLPYLATSTDHGRTWSKPLMIAPPNVREVQWPTVYAGANGRIAISFPGTTQGKMSDKTRPWDYYVVTSTNALATNPTFVSNIANPATDPVHRGDCPGRCGNMLDFLDLVIQPTGAPINGLANPVWATVVDTCTSKDRCNTTRRKGFTDGGGDGVSSDMKGLYVRQVGGQQLGW